MEPTIAYIVSVKDTDALHALDKKIYYLAHVETSKEEKTTEGTIRATMHVAASCATDIFALLLNETAAGRVVSVAVSPFTYDTLKNWDDH